MLDDNGKTPADRYAELLSKAPVELLVFDLEGTVIDTEDAWDVAQGVLLDRRGRKYDRDAVKHRLTGLSAAEAGTFLIEYYGLADSLSALLAERFDLMLAELSRGVPYIDGFSEFVKNLPGDMPVCAATGMGSDMFAVVDGWMKLSQLFGGRVHRADALGLPSKPAPDLFRHAAAAAGAQPAGCVVFEDAPNGVAAARAAGMRCVALATTHRRDLLAGADLVVNSWDDLR